MLTKLLSIALCLFMTIQCKTHAAKILLSLMPQGRSHAGSFAPMMKTLVEHGHNVTVTFEIYKPELPLGGGVNERLVQIKGMDLSLEKDASFNDLIWKRTLSGITMAIPHYSASLSCAYYIEHQPTDFWSIANDDWDLVITDSVFSPCGYAMALLSRKKGVPYAVFHPTELPAMTSYYKALRINNAILPRVFLPADDPSYHVTRFSNRARSFLEVVELHVAAALSDYYMRRAVGGLVDYRMHDYAVGAALDLTDMPVRIAFSHPQGNDVLSVGAYCKKAKPVPKEMNDFISAGKSKGTILVAFGTVVNWDGAPSEVLEAFANALNALTDYKIIWGYSGPKLKMKKHVWLQKWVPQGEILEDSRTVLFVSHGGLKSVKEAICSETPVLYMPMFAEQTKNTWLARTWGFAENVSKFNVTAGYLEAQMRRILDNKSYKDNVLRIKRIYADNLVEPLQQGAHAIRKVLQYGANMPGYFYRRAMHQSFVKYFHVDLLVLIGATIISFGV